MRFAFLSILVLVFNVALAEGPPCKAKMPLTDDQMTPNLFKAWLDGNGKNFKDLGDLVCCLPESFKNPFFLVAHSSISGQPGTPESPRLILHRSLQGPEFIDLDAPQMILTINGGLEDQVQGHSMEMGMYEKRRLTLFDIEHKKSKFEFSKPNPETCMKCHGVGGSEYDKEGPRSLFEHFGRWPRMVGGSHSCNKAEDALQKLKQGRALRELLKNPRFACLDKSYYRRELEALEKTKGAEVPTLTNALPARFNSYLVNINANRTANIMRRSANYDSYKFAIFGAVQCKDFKMDQWLPPQVLAQHSNLSFVSPEAARIKRPADIKPLVDSIKQVATKEQEKQLAELVGPIKDVYSKPIQPGSTIFSCPDKLSEKVFVQELQKAAAEKNDYLRPYLIDQLTGNGTSGAIAGPEFSYVRFLFEGRGISTRTWSTDMIPGPFRDNQSFKHDLIQTEPADSPLAKTNQELTALNLDGHGHKKKRTKILCEQLRKQSWAALSLLPAEKLPTPAATPASGIK